MPLATLPKAVLLVLIIRICVQNSLAQDTTSITFTEEAISTNEQRFIDRYETAFMTKVPTRKIIKIGYTSTTYKGIGISAAFEYKILPSWSIEAGLYSRATFEGDGVFPDKINSQLRGKNLFWAANTRWYYHMKKRIALEKSANNFSGGYFSLDYERSFLPIQGAMHREHISINYGFQSRFLSNGFVDFSLGLFYISPDAIYYNTDNSAGHGFKVQNMILASRSAVGLAFGDWKKNGKAPLCDILHCDYLIKEQFKIKLPELNIGLRVQSVRVKVAYERKLGKAPLSIEASISNVTNNYPQGQYSTTNISTMGNLEFRYYFLQRRQIRKGRASDNLSGFYLAPHITYNYNYANISRRINFHRQSVSYGGIVGYQQRLFRNIYFDATLSYSGTSMDKRFTKINSAEAIAKVGIGFAI
jgi:hypothetical protein